MQGLATGDIQVTDIQLLNAKEVCAAVGISTATMYRLIRNGKFPRPLKLGPQATRWRFDEVAAHIERLSESRPRSAA